MTKNLKQQNSTLNYFHKLRVCCSTLWYCTVANICKQRMDISLKVMLVSQLRLYIHGHRVTKSPFKLYLVLVMVEKQTEGAFEIWHESSSDEQRKRNILISWFGPFMRIRLRQGGQREQHSTRMQCARAAASRNKRAPAAGSLKASAPCLRSQLIPNQHRNPGKEKKRWKVSFDARQGRKRRTVGKKKKSFNPGFYNQDTESINLVKNRPLPAVNNKHVMESRLQPGPSWSNNLSLTVACSLADKALHSQVLREEKPKEKKIIISSSLFSEVRNIQLVQVIWFCLLWSEVAQCGFKPGKRFSYCTCSAAEPGGNEFISRTRPLHRNLPLIRTCPAWLLWFEDWPFHWVALAVVFCCRLERLCSLREGVVLTARNQIG